MSPDFVPELAYWKTRAEQLGRESAGRLKETGELWRRLVTAEQCAARHGVDIQDPQLIAHSMELEATALAGRTDRDSLDALRCGILQDLYEAETGIEEHGRSKADAFDWLAKRIRLRNASAFKQDTISEARKIVAAQRADAVLAPAITREATR